MARITVEDCLEKEQNRFALVILASKRTKELLGGASLLVSETDNKEVVGALREIAEGKVRFLTKEEESRSTFAIPVQEAPLPASSQLDELERLFEDPSSL